MDCTGGMQVTDNLHGIALHKVLVKKAGIWEKRRTKSLLAFLISIAMPFAVFTCLYAVTSYN